MRYLIQLNTHTFAMALQSDNDVVMTDNFMTDNFTVAIIGDIGVGKTVFVQRHVTGEFIRRYYQSTEVKKSVLEFNTNYGVKSVSCLDVPSNVNITEKADAYIVMFDVTSKNTYLKALDYYNSITDKTSPIVVIGNKVDCFDRKVELSDIKFPSNKNIPYTDISVRSNYNYNKPFLILLRKLTGHDDLVFVDIE